MEDRGPSAYVAEFLGTLLLVFAISMVITTQTSGGTPEFIVIALLHFLALAVLIASLGGTSGAHFNPAVTVTLAALRKISVNDAGIYIVCQCAGGIVGALLVKFILVDEGRGSHYGAVGRGPLIEGRTSLSFLCEALGGFILMWAIMAAAVNPRANAATAPWVIGAALAFAVMMFGPVTGAGLNPARALGPAVAGSDFGGVGRWLVAFVAGPVVGALVAGFGYMALVLNPQEKLFGGRLVDADVPPGRVPGEVEAALDGPGERPVDKLS
jgi:MIP family channel proteins